MAASPHGFAQVFEGDARRDGDEHGFGLQGGEGFGDDAADEVGLHADDDDVARGDEPRNVRHGGDAFGDEGVKALRGAVVAEEAQAGHAGESADDGPAHVAAADAADGFAGERCWRIHRFLFRARGREEREKPFRRPAAGDMCGCTGPLSAAARRGTGVRLSVRRSGRPVPPGSRCRPGSAFLPRRAEGAGGRGGCPCPVPPTSV